MATPIVFIALLLVLPAARAVDHIVGDSAGWAAGPDYSTWASGKTFAVGDTLVFNYGGSHSVDVVNKGDYDSCATGSALQSYNGGSSKIPLTKAGPMYFLCPVFGHCTGGMKLAVTVSAAGNTPSTGASPATPTPTTPSTTTPSADTPPTTTPSSASTPSTNGASRSLYTVVVGVCAIFAPLVALMG